MIQDYDVEEAVRLIREAQEYTQGWTAGDHDRVEVTRPEHLNHHDWSVLVALYRKPGENPALAGERLARYLTAYRERFGRAPRLAQMRLNRLAHIATHPRPARS